MSKPDSLEHGTNGEKLDEPRGRRLLQRVEPGAENCNIPRFGAQLDVISGEQRAKG